jgi:hypothetical protein
MFVHNIPAPETKKPAEKFKRVWEFSMPRFSRIC